MDPKEYKRLYENENEHWWFTGTRSLIFSTIDKIATSKDTLTIADIGCGTGKLCQEQQKRYPSWKIIGLDLSPIALSLSSENPRTKLL